AGVLQCNHSRCQRTELPDIPPPRRVRFPLRRPFGPRRIRTAMLKKVIVDTVDRCTRYATQIVGIAVLLALVGGLYAAKHFAIDADVNKLISKELPWRQREAAYEQFFPVKEEIVLAVIDAPTSELATQAAAALTQQLSEQKNLFRA